jgi:predicted dehydrogenase
MKQLLDSDELGELRRIEFIHHRGGYYEEGSGIWRTRPETSGGLILEESIHEVDIFRCFAGEVRAVQATSGPNVLANYRVPDNICIHLFFERGILGTILTTHTLSAYTPEPAKWPRLGHNMDMVFTCTRGAAAVDFINSRILVNRYEDYPRGAEGTRVVFDRVEDYSLFEGHMSFFHDIDPMRKEFIRRCAHGEPPVQDILDAWRTHVVCLAAEESATTDFRRIEMDYALPRELL